MGMKSSKPGTTTSTVKFGKGMDPIETLILSEGLRIVDVHPYRELDLLAIVINSGDILQARISDFERLRKATDKQLENWQLIGGGIGIHWEAMDEDISLRGFIRDAAQQEALRRLSTNPRKKRIAAGRS